MPQARDNAARLDPLLDLADRFDSDMMVAAVDVLSPKQICEKFALTEAAYEKLASEVLHATVSEANRFWGPGDPRHDILKTLTAVSELFTE